MNAAERGYAKSLYTVTQCRRLSAESSRRLSPESSPLAFGLDSPTPGPIVTSGKTQDQEGVQMGRETGQ